MGAPSLAAGKSLNYRHRGVFFKASGGSEEAGRGSSCGEAGQAGGQTEQMVRNEIRK